MVRRLRTVRLARFRRFDAGLFLAVYLGHSATFARPAYDSYPPKELNLALCRRGFLTEPVG